MTELVSRPYSGQSDLDLVANLCREMAIRRMPGVTYMNPGDAAWQLYLGTSPEWFELIHLWFAGDRLAAWAFFEPPLTAEMDVHADFANDDTFDKVTGWLMEKRRAVMGEPTNVPTAYAMLEQEGMSVTSLESDSVRNAYLAGHGWQITEARHNVKCQRSLLGDIPPVPLPDGYQVRNVTEADVEARAELHRDAWSVWGPSKFSANRYRRLRAQPLYNEYFDVVTEAPDGTLLSTCVGWFDPESGIGQFEPVGTRTTATGHGYGKAAIIEGLRRMKAAGGHTAHMGTASVNEGGMRLYPACGFEFVEKEVYWSKPVR